MTSTEERAESGDAALPQSGLKPDVKAGLVMLGFSAIAFAGTFTFESVPDGLIQGLGAAAFPRLVIGIIAILSVLLILRARKENFEAPEPVHPMTLGTVGAQLIFMAIIPVVGLIGAMFVAIAGIGRLWGARWRPALITAAITAAVIYGLFVSLFRIQLPLGMLKGLFS